MLVPCTLAIFSIPAINQEQNKLTKAAFQEYFDSPMWTYQKASKNIIGSLTHSMRNDRGEIDGCGASDAMLRDGVITHCLKDAWINEAGTKVEGIIEIFDDIDMYSDSQKPSILQLLRLIKNGVHVGLSLVVDGDWDDKTNELTHIFEIAGVDFTLDPAFVYTETTQSHES